MQRIEHKFINNIECKYCSGCKKYYILSEFIRDPKSWDKLYYLCPECRKKARNPDVIKRASKLKWEKKKKIKDYSKIQYAEADKDKLYLRMKRSRSREEYKEHAKAKDSKWARENKDRVNERGRKYREERKKRMKGYVTVCDKCGNECEFGGKTKKEKRITRRRGNASSIEASCCVRVVMIRW